MSVVKAVSKPEVSSEQTLRITEIFYSLQGESTRVGLPTIFIRLTGCPLRCGYCDSEYAFSGGQKRPIAHIIQDIAAYNTPYVTVTGGEPLAQPHCHELLKQLCDLDYQVSLETSGAMPIAAVDPRVMVVMDIKTPGSKEMHRNDLHNLNRLKANDELKLVICNRQDYLWAKDFLIEHKLLNKPFTILFSPSYEQCSAQQLAEWILQDQLPVRFQTQLHKTLWGDVPGV